MPPLTFETVAIITPNWAEQGTARASKSVAIILSRLVSKILVTKVAIVSHPNPRTSRDNRSPRKPNALEQPINEQSKSWEVTAIFNERKD